MTMKAHLAPVGDYYLPARTAFEEIIAWQRASSGSIDHAAWEVELRQRGTELLMRLFQSGLDELSHAEEKANAAQPPQEGVNVRSYTRQSECEFGTVSLRRLGFKVAGERRQFPLDRLLNWPADRYSHPLRQRVVEEARDRAWDHAVKRIDRTTGGHVPKRQAQELAIKATQDYDEYYATREPPKSLGTSAVILGSSDSTGVRVVARALRPATRAAAEKEKAKAVRGDPMQRKKPRSHDKRMAVIAEVWEQEPVPRTAQDIISELHRTPATSRKKGPKTQKKAPQPQKKEERPETQKEEPKTGKNKAGKAQKKKALRPQNRRVWGSVQRGVSEGVAEVFDEFDRRDPERARKTAMLVDGEEHQQTAILEEARRRGRSMTIVLDIIHVIHYLWIAGFAFCHRKRNATNVWVTEHLRMLLTSSVAGVIAAIELAATTQRLSDRERKSVEKALRYLRRNSPFLDYPTYLALGLPIATGIIEGACRHLAKDRLGITGARWGLIGAEAMLRLRALYSSGDWDDYWRFHLKKEALRNYGAAA